MYLETYFFSVQVKTEKLCIWFYSLEPKRYLCREQVESTQGRQLTNLASIGMKSSVNIAHTKQCQNRNSNTTLKMTILKINTEQTLTFAHAKLLEFHILELKILNSLIQYKFLTYGHFPCYGLPLVILMPATVTHKG